MAEPYIPDDVIFFCGIICSSQIQAETGAKEMSSLLGEISFHAGPFPFTHTDYYGKIGTDLLRFFYAFKPLHHSSVLTNAKLHSNHIEKQLSHPAYSGKRDINIDPGYLNLHQVCLASCKPYYHRIYANDGVYTELEYFYSNGKFNFLEWTYPDYKNQNYIDFFIKLRSEYKSMI